MYIYFLKRRIVFQWPREESGIGVGAEGGEDGALMKFWGGVGGGARGPEPGTGCSLTLRAQVKVVVCLRLENAEADETLLLC